MSHGNEMICQSVTLSGYAEWPKVADAVIEAIDPLEKCASIPTGDSLLKIFDFVGEEGAIVLRAPNVSNNLISEVLHASRDQLVS